MIFAYRGMVTNENSTSLLMLLEKEIESSEFGYLARKRLFMFVVESLQNVSRHSNPEKYGDMSLVLYARNPEGYTVTTGNVIENQAIENLREKLERINSLNPGNIRNVYRQMLNASEFSSKGGAGLGLIEMAKKTGNRLDFDFIPLDNKYSYFILSKTVDASGKSCEDITSSRKFKSSVVIEIERLMTLNNIYLIWSGHFSTDLSDEVLKFTETDLTEKSIKSSLKRKIFGILIEALENVAKHSPGSREAELYGMPLLIFRQGDANKYSIVTGNLIENNKIQPLKEKIDIINNASKESLKTLITESLRQLQINSRSTGNLGLLEMARKSGGRLNYSFDKINDRYSYFTLDITITEK